MSAESLGTLLEWVKSERSKWSDDYKKAIRRRMSEAEGQGLRDELTGAQAAFDEVRCKIQLMIKELSPLSDEEKEKE